MVKRANVAKITPASPFFRNLDAPNTDVPDVGQPMSPMSVNRCPRCRFEGCGSVFLEEYEN